MKSMHDASHPHRLIFIRRSPLPSFFDRKGQSILVTFVVDALEQGKSIYEDALCKMQVTHTIS